MGLIHYCLMLHSARRKHSLKSSRTEADCSICIQEFDKKSDLGYNAESPLTFLSYNLLSVDASVQYNVVLRQTSAPHLLESERL